MTMPANLHQPIHREPARLLRRQDGAALITVLLFSALLLSLAIFGSTTSRIEAIVARNQLFAKKALEIADAGLNHGFSLVKTAGGTSFTDDLASSGTAGALVGLGSVQTVDATSYRFASFGGGGATDGYYVRLADNYDEWTGANDPSRDRDGILYIVSMGRFMGAERVVVAQVDGRALFKNGLVGKRSVSITGTSVVDSYDSSVGAYKAASAGSRGDLRSNGNITLNSNATIRGSAIASGSVSSGTITGARIQNAAPLDLSSVTPCGPPYSSNTGITGSGSWSYNAATGVLTEKSTAIINLAANTYCFASITQSGSATITVSAAVKINLTGSFDLSGGGIVNSTAKPVNFTVYASTPAGVTFNVRGGTNAFFAIYAPDADVSFVGTSDAYGALVAGSINKTTTSGFHVDESLFGLVSGATLLRWHEVRNF
ncbi:MAG: hypothetical protein HY270_09810 [Deltaproteobacteria bacterium]|nr:hypothetical protein [Deltaproteobacteria bacterium]